MRSEMTGVEIELTENFGTVKGKLKIYQPDEAHKLTIND